MTAYTGKQRQYSEENIATALATLVANNNNLTQTAKQLDIPLSTLNVWQKKQNRAIPAICTKVQDKKEELAAKFEKAAALLLDRAMAPDAIEKARAGEAMLASAQATDKALLLRGESTSNNVVTVEYATNWRDLG